MMDRTVAPLLLSLVLSACQTKPADAPAQPTAASAQPAAPSSRPGSQPSSRPKEASVTQQTEADWTTGPVHRGAPFSVESETELAAVIGKPDEFQGKLVKVTGQVTRACSKKGCWMELRSNPEQAGVRITFKDYGFFVPLDSAGATAIVEGTVKVEHLAADHVQHLKAEGAQVVADTKGEAHEIGLIATAVRLEKPQPSAAQ